MMDISTKLSSSLVTVDAHIVITVIVIVIVNLIIILLVIRQKSTVSSAQLLKSLFSVYSIVLNQVFVFTCPSTFYIDCVLFVLCGAVVLVKQNLALCDTRTCGSDDKGRLVLTLFLLPPLLKQ